MITATRYHDISCGHRVAGHESKCALLHGHNYRITFTCRAAALDQVGRVIDFSVMKEKLCMWVEEHWDHRFLAWKNDDFMQCVMLAAQDANITERPGMEPVYRMLKHSMVWTPFNPTAENMAEHLLSVIGPAQLNGTGVDLIKVIVEETRKCSAEATR
jgi:6-pyruvoyltetrahydropterin/6-carboxytetrahydropterin synthase